MQNNSPSKLLIVDDNYAVRTALASLISTVTEFKICAEAEDANGAIKSIIELEPDIAIIDISLKGSNGIDLIKQIRAIDRNVRILAWSLYGENPYAELAIDAGANGYITKDQAIGQITDVLRQIMSGQTYISASISQDLPGYAVTTHG